MKNSVEIGERMGIDIKEMIDEKNRVLMKEFIK